MKTVLTILFALSHFCSAPRNRVTLKLDTFGSENSMVMKVNNWNAICSFRVYFMSYIFVLFSQIIDAQSVGLECGVKGGASLAGAQLKITNDLSVFRISEYSGDFIPSFVLGGWAKWRFNDKLSTNLEIQWSRKGYRMLVKGVDDSGELQITDQNKIVLSYLNMPITIGWQFTKRLFAEAGPYAGLALFGKIKSTVNTFDIVTRVDYSKSGSQKIAIQRETTNTESTFKRLDFGLDFAAGYRNKRSALGLGFGYGLANVMPLYADAKSSAYYQGITLFFAYLLN